MKFADTIVVFGGTGLLGSSIVRQLEKKGYRNIVIASRSRGIDLMDYNSLCSFIKTTQPKYVFMVAGLVGGILGNKKRNADFLHDNSIMILNLLAALSNFSPKAKLLYTGSTCIYPKVNPQPIKENRFLSGPLEDSNKGYAVAKITGVVGCELYNKQYGLKTIAVMPSNLYGPNDNYDFENGHMIPSLIKKFIEAKKSNMDVSLWGSGNPRREALYVDDCADACIYLMNNCDEFKLVNIGTGFDYSIKEFAEMIAEVLNYHPKINWDKGKPDGTFEKRVDITLLKSLMPSFSPRGFKEGLKEILEKDFKYKF